MDIKELRLAALDRALDNRNGSSSDMIRSEPVAEVLKRASQYMGFIETGDVPPNPMAIVKFQDGAAIQANRIAAIRPMKEEEAHGLHGTDYPPMVFVEALDQEGKRTYLFTKFKVATNDEAESLCRELVRQWEAGLKGESGA